MVKVVGVLLLLCPKTTVLGPPFNAPMAMAGRLLRTVVFPVPLPRSKVAPLLPLPLTKRMLVLVVRMKAPLNPVRLPLRSKRPEVMLRFTVPSPVTVFTFPLSRAVRVLIPVKLIGVGEVEVGDIEGCVFNRNRSRAQGRDVSDYHGAAGDGGAAGEGVRGIASVRVPLPALMRFIVPERLPPLKL